MNPLEVQRQPAQRSQADDSITSGQAMFCCKCLVQLFNRPDQHAAGVGDGIMHLAALRYDFQDMFAHPGCISFARLRDLCEAGRVNVQRLYTDERLTRASDWSIIEFPCRLRQAALGLDDTVDTQAGDDFLFSLW